MSFSKRQGNDVVCYTKPLDSLKSWNDHFFWVDAFACPASFSWNTSKSVSKDPFPKSSQYNAEHYATLVAYPAPFHKYPEPFLCLVGISRNYTLDEDTYPQFLHENGEEMDLLSFIRTADPTKVRVGERQRAEDEPKLLDTTIRRVVPLLLFAPARGESELEDTKTPKKRKTVVVDAGGPSHPAKKLRDDHDASTGPSVVVKSKSTLQRSLAGAVLNPEVGIATLPTLPFVTSSVSATPKQEGEDQTDSMAGTNLPTITAPQRFVISSDSSHHSVSNVAEAEVDSVVRSFVPAIATITTVTATVDAATVPKEAPIKPSLFGVGSSSAGGTNPTPGAFFDVSCIEFLIGGIHIVVDPDFDIQKVYVPQWSVTNGSRLDDGRVNREMLDEFAPLKFFASIHEMEHDQLFTEFNVGAACQISLSAEARDAEIEGLKAQLLVKEAEAAEAIRLRAEASKFEAIEKSLQDELRVLKDHNTTLEKEKSELDVKVADLVASVHVREQEAGDLDAMVTSVKSQNDNLVDQVHKLETSSTVLQEKVTVYEDCMSQLEKFQDEQMDVVYEKFNKLHADFIEMALYLEERLYPHLLTTIAGRRWLLTYGMELVVAKCLNSSEYLSALGAAISKAIEKGMQDGLAARITHGQEGRVLTDVAAFNPSAESDYIFALQDLQSVNFSLLADLKSNKDASLETLMDILCLDDTLAERLGLNESQPHVDQLMVPVHHSPDHTVIGARALSLSLDVSHSRVQRIKENIAKNRPAPRDVFVPLAEPLSIVALEGTGGTSGTAPDTTTALSTTYMSASSIPPISTDDYMVVYADSQEGTGADGQTGAGADVNPFPNVEDAELDIS
ncbi:hypothetical protein Tco_1339340 [Tanacetum coccineum]